MPTHAAAGRPKVNGEQVDLGKPQKPKGTSSKATHIKGCFVFGVPKHIGLCILGCLLVLVFGSGGCSGHIGILFALFLRKKEKGPYERRNKSKNKG